MQKINDGVSSLGSFMDFYTNRGVDMVITLIGILIIFTYLAVGLYLNAIKVNEPWLNAIVPALAFMLSTFNFEVNLYADLI